MLYLFYTQIINPSHADKACKKGGNCFMPITDDAPAFERQGFLREDFRPVSYTHLDVYKRQLKYTVRHILLGYICLVSGIIENYSTYPVCVVHNHF